MKSDGTAVIVLWFVLAIVVVSAIGVGRGRNENATAEWPRITKIKRQFCLSRPDRATATQTPDDGGLDGRTGWTDWARVDTADRPTRSGNVRRRRWRRHGRREIYDDDLAQWSPISYADGGMHRIKSEAKVNLGPFVEALETHNFYRLSIESGHRNL